MDGTVGRQNRSKWNRRVVRLASAYLKRLSLHDPEFNLREIAKQLLLLEEHLFHPHKLCPDCVRKHLMTVEALGDEAVALVDPAKGTPEWAETMWQAGSLYSDLAKMWLEQFNDGRDPKDLGVEVRAVRKKAVAATPDPRHSADRIASVYIARHTLCEHNR